MIQKVISNLLFRRQASLVNLQRLYFAQSPQNASAQTITYDESSKTDLGKQAAMKDQKSEEALTLIEEYKKALHFFHNGKYRISNEFFKRVLTQLKKNGQESTDNYIYVLKKLAVNQNKLKLFEESEKLLEEIIEKVQKRTTTEAIIYREYNNLFLHCLKCNLNKAILLGKALLSEQEKKNIPLAYQKIFTFNLGTAYLLKGNFIDAKHRLRECLVWQPNHLLKGFALNNLAVASWWHKHPNFRQLHYEESGTDGPIPLQAQQPKPREIGVEESEYTGDQIDKDFENVLGLLKRALYNIENVDQNKDMNIRQQLKVLLDQDRLVPKQFEKFDPAINMLLQNKESGIPLLNIQEFCFSTDPEKRNEATFWFKYALKFYETVDPANIDRCLITLALFCSSSHQYDKAEALFKKALDMLEGSDSYNKVLCLQLYGNLLKKIPKRNKEGEKVIALAYNIADTLPFWSNRIIHVCIPKEDQ